MIKYVAEFCYFSCIESRKRSDNFSVYWTPNVMVDRRHSDTCFLK